RRAGTFCAGDRLAMKKAPTARTSAKPPRMYQRYFSSGSGASIGGPKPPPGRLSEACAAPMAPPPPADDALSLLAGRTPDPEILNANGCFGWALETTCTIASLWPGSCIDWKDAGPENFMDLGSMTTKWSTG